MECVYFEVKKNLMLGNKVEIPTPSTPKFILSACLISKCGKFFEHLGPNRSLFVKPKDNKKVVLEILDVKGMISKGEIVSFTYEAVSSQ